jgi:hypothetical protein
MTFNDEYLRLVRGLTRQYGIKGTMKIKGVGVVKSNLHLLQ